MCGFAILHLRWVLLFGSVLGLMEFGVYVVSCLGAFGVGDLSFRICVCGCELGLVKVLGWCKTKF